MTANLATSSIPTQGRRKAGLGLFLFNLSLLFVCAFALGDGWGPVALSDAAFSTTSLQAASGAPSSDDRYLPFGLTLCMLLFSMTKPSERVSLKLGAAISAGLFVVAYGVSVAMVPGIEKEAAQWERDHAHLRKPLTTEQLADLSVCERLAIAKRLEETFYLRSLPAQITGYMQVRARKDCQANGPKVQELDRLLRQIFTEPVR